MYLLSNMAILGIHVRLGGDTLHDVCSCGRSDPSFDLWKLN